MDEIAIVLACDDRYAQHAAVAAASMLLCHTDSRPLHFYLFDDGITGVKKEMVERTIKDLKGLVTFIDTKGIAVDAGLPSPSYCKTFALSGCKGPLF